MEDVKLKAFELSMEVARLPKQYAPNTIGGYASPAADSIEVILTRAAMIEKYLVG
jgi:hypothetical protein